MSGIEIAALFIPEFQVSLLSVSQFDDSNLTTTFFDTTCHVSDSSGETLLEAPLVHGLYRFQASTALLMLRQKEESEALIAIAANRKWLCAKLVKMSLWHRRLAHLHPMSLEKISVPRQTSGTQEVGCEVCLRAKSKQFFNRDKVSRSSTPFELVHSDLCGPFPTSVGGSVYYLLYIDDCSRYTEVFFLRSKSASEIIPKFSQYKAWVQNQGYHIKQFRCDNGSGEFNNAEFLDLLLGEGIIFEPAPPYTQHKNGVAERMIPTINIKARCMLLDAELDARFWAEAVAYSCLPPSPHSHNKPATRYFTIQNAIRHKTQPSTSPPLWLYRV